MGYYFRVANSKAHDVSEGRYISTGGFIVRALRGCAHLDLPRVSSFTVFINSAFDETLENVFAVVPTLALLWSEDFFNPELVVYSSDER